ncbi:MAG: hypothetical protein ACL7AX_07365 [Candidatus Arsenophonus phytopathogenicus]
MEITFSSVANINHVKLKTDNDSDNNKLKNDKSAKQRLDENMATVVPSEEVTEIAAYFEMMNAMSAHRAENIRNTQLKKRFQAKFLLMFSI